MRTLLVAAAFSTLFLAPVGAYAQTGGTQTTPAQQDLKDGVKAEPRTMKRQEIIRSETNKNDTTGTAPGPNSR